MKLTHILTLVLLLLVAGCGGDPHEALADETMDYMDEMVSILEGVDSEDDVEAASEKLAALATEMQDLAKRMEEIGEPSPEKSAELEKKFTERMTNMQGRISKAMMELDPGAMAKLSASMQEAMSALGN